MNFSGLGNTMDPRRLRYFLAVVDEGHLGRAAQRLRIAQPALSQQIKRIETELGVPLFDRTSRQLELTHAGRTLVDEARDLLEHINRTWESARMAGHGELGTLHVGMVGSAVLTLLTPVMRAFQRRCPGARLHVAEMPSGFHHVEAIRERRVDVGLLRYPTPPAHEVTVEPVRTEPLAVAMPADHRLAGREVLTAEDLRDEAFVNWPRWGSPQLYDETFAESGPLGFPPRVVHQAHGIQANLGIVSSGVGISLMPASVTEHPRPGVTFRPLAEPAPRTTLAAAWRPRTHMPLLEHFLDIVRDTAGAR